LDLQQVVSSTVSQKIIRTVLCCIVYDNYAQWHAYTYEQFLNVDVGLGLDFIFVCLLRFSIICVFCVSLDHFIPVLLAFVVFSFFSTKLRDWLRKTSPKWPILCQVGRKTPTQSIKWPTKYISGSRQLTWRWAPRLHVTEPWMQWCWLLDFSYLDLYYKQQSNYTGIKGRWEVDILNSYRVK